MNRPRKARLAEDTRTLAIAVFRKEICYRNSIYNIFALSHDKFLLDDRHRWQYDRTLQDMNDAYFYMDYGIQIATRWLLCTRPACR
jgi:hypothetical protein